jgi:hypothetical protein
MTNVKRPFPVPCKLSRDIFNEHQLVNIKNLGHLTNRITALESWIDKGLMGRQIEATVKCFEASKVNFRTSTEEKQQWQRTG